jgi:ABC-2 type transport system permease protein
MNTPGIGRLTIVEIRKMADTRSGVWLLAVAGLISVGIVTLILVVGDGPDLTLAGLFAPTLFPLSVFLPILGILAVTTEWSQRTALTTFALVPRRHRVAVAKLIAAVLLALGSAAAGLAVAAGGNLLGAAVAGGDGGWHLPAADLGKGVLYLVVSVLLGVGFGLLLMNSALAIVLVLVLPIVWSILAGVEAMRTTVEWLDISVTTGLLIDNAVPMDGTDWARLGTSVGVWVLLPTAAGLARLLRREVA